jgi:hypothetical protein
MLVQTANKMGLQKSAAYEIELSGFRLKGRKL